MRRCPFTASRLWITPPCSRSPTPSSHISRSPPPRSRNADVGAGSRMWPSASTGHHGALPAPEPARPDSAPASRRSWARRSYFPQAHYTRVGGRCAAVDHVGRRVSREQFDARRRARPRWRRSLRAGGGSSSKIGKSAFGGKPENICSFWAFPVLDHKRHCRVQDLFLWALQSARFYVAVLEAGHAEIFAWKRAAGVPSAGIALQQTDIPFLPASISHRGVVRASARRMVQ